MTEKEMKRWFELKKSGTARKDEWGIAMIDFFDR